VLIGRSNTSVFTQQFLVKNKMAVIPHPPYSPDLAPCGFFLFPKMKLKLNGRLFHTIERSRPNRREFLTLTEKDVQEEFQKWRSRCDRCLNAGGTTSRVMAADRPYGEFYDFYSVSPKYFGYHHVRVRPVKKLPGFNETPTFITTARQLLLS
jgi:hypothetical protein